jgi:hypothetical protein
MNTPVSYHNPIRLIWQAGKTPWLAAMIICSIIEQVLVFLLPFYCEVWYLYEDLAFLLFYGPQRARLKPACFGGGFWFLWEGRAV